MKKEKLKEQLNFNTQKLKNNKAITLIALAVTIVVLLILAGITLNLVLDNNGIISKSKDARNKWIEAQEKEKKDIDDFVKENMPSWNGRETELPQIKENENTGKFDWYIYNEAQMKFLADYVNETLTEQEQKMITDNNTTVDEIKITEETTIYLMNDLNLGAMFDNSGNLLSGEQWIPIGTNKTLEGTFEGNNHYICGVYINREDEFNGIFGYCNSIKNLTIKNSYIEGLGCTGGIAGGVRNGGVENCHNINTIIVQKKDGDTVGGVVAQCESDIKNCTNTGTIYVEGRNSQSKSQAGGIVGISVGSKISNCINKGNIISGEEAGIYIGGICGCMEADTEITISDCRNEGNINGIAVTGGIVGLLSTKGIVERCSNVGDIHSAQMAAAGIAGQTNQKSGQSNSIVRQCYNSGNITGGKWLGGIVAYFCGKSQQGTVENCYSKGTITATENDSGAIIGKKIQDDGNATFNNLYYLKTIGLYAVNNNATFESETVKAVEDDIKTYEEFIEWIKTK